LQNGCSVKAQLDTPTSVPPIIVHTTIQFVKIQLAIVMSLNKSHSQDIKGMLKTHITISIKKKYPAKKVPSSLQKRLSLVRQSDTPTNNPHSVANKKVASTSM
jgi:hypothetical protein